MFISRHKGELLLGDQHLSTLQLSSVGYFEVPIPCGQDIWQMQSI